MRVREVMTTPAVAVTPAATISEAIAVLAGRGITTLPVVDDTGRLLGLLTEDDVIRATYLPDPRSAGGPDAGVYLGGAVTVRAIMRQPAAGTRPDTDVTALAEGMLERRIRSIPVLEKGHVIGIVTWQDLLSAQIEIPAQRNRP